MGRKTYDSLGKCLPNRYNIVLSRQFDLFEDRSNCVLREGIYEGLVESEMSPAEFAETFVIGGSTMYSQFHDLVDRYLITIVDKKVENGDAFFDLKLFDLPDEWTVDRVVGPTQGDGDEASYEIFELVSRDVEGRQARRQSAIATIREKRMARNGGGRRPRLRDSDPGMSPVFSWI